MSNPAGVIALHVNMRAPIKISVHMQAVVSPKMPPEVARHIADTENPHRTTAEQVGAYTKAQADEHAPGALTNAEIDNILNLIF